jgi:hemoglobin
MYLIEFTGEGIGMPDHSSDFAIVQDEGGPERRSKITSEIMDKTGIDDAMIERLVRTFYGRVQRDPLIGPVFAAKVSDWEHHIAKLCAFWSSVALMSGRYHGQPMPKHMTLPIDGSHFDRWLALFEATARELCPPVAAVHFIERARRIADSLEMGVATRQGRIYNPRHSIREVEP